MSNKKLHEPKYIEIDTIEEFDTWVTDGFNSGGKLMISKTIVDSILNNLDQKQIHIFEVLVKDENAIYDISVNEDDFIFTLEKNLRIMEIFEEFEICSKIVETINKLKNGQTN